MLLEPLVSSTNEEHVDTFKNNLTDSSLSSHTKPHLTAHNSKGDLVQYLYVELPRQLLHLLEVREQKLLETDNCMRFHCMRQ